MERPTHVLFGLVTQKVAGLVSELRRACGGQGEGGERGVGQDGSRSNSETITPTAVIYSSVPRDPRGWRRECYQGKVHKGRYQGSIQTGR